MNEKVDPQDDWRSVLSRPVVLETFKPLSSDIELEIGAASACGRYNAHNTDHYLAMRLGRRQETLVTSLAANDLPPRFEEYGYALLVADGLGGAAAGARASRVALSALAHQVIRYGKWNVRVGPETMAELEDQGQFFFRQINDAVLEASRADVRLADMATSLILVYIAETSLFFAHVGRSSAFLFREGTLIRLTTDDMPGEKQTGGSQPRKRLNVGVKHVVTEALGTRPSGPDLEIEHVQLWSGDRVILCTNGLTDMLPEDLIADELALRRRPKDDCRRLVDLAWDGPDDVTVLIADYRTRTAVGHAEMPAGGTPHR